MSLSCCSLDVIYRQFDSFRYTNKSPSAYKQFALKNLDVHNCNRSAKRSAICSHLMPGKSIEGLYAGRKRLEVASCKLEFVRTLLIDNYDSYTYNIYQELSIVNGVPPVVVRNDDWTWDEICYYLYDKKAFDNIVISPGPGSPKCAADIGISLELLQKCKDIPILGVCLGHQALGYVHGARIVHAPEPVHGRLSEIEHTNCILFHHVPSGKGSGFKVMRYHSLVIDAESLPRNLLPIAWTSVTDTLPFLESRSSELCRDAYESQLNQTIASDSFPKSFTNGSASCFKEMQPQRVLMGIMHSTRPHYGLQFHPESIATCHGRQIFKNFRAMTVDYWLGMRSFSISNRKVHNADLPRTSRGPKFLRLKWKKLDCLASQLGGTQNIFCKLFGDYKAQNTFWLDSSSTEKGRARFSFMGGKGGSLWKQVIFRLSDERTYRHGGHLTIEDAEGSIKKTYLEDGFFEYLNKELQSYCYTEKEYEGLPFEFHGGYIGYIGYDLKAECGVASNRHRSKVPDACFFFADNFVAVDHHLDDVYILSLDDKSSSGTTWLDTTEQKLLQLKASDAHKPIVQLHEPSIYNPCHTAFVTDRSKEQYIKDIERCLSFIKEGESYELCFTTQMRKRLKKDDYLALYLNLREKNPAPYAAWLSFSDENLCVCSSSPERFLQMDKSGVLEARPIKGTVARGSTEVEDEQLKLQLQYSEKDQAENLMIVDLLRNDLGRVCEPGSVHVPRLMEVESYATVHTMVSTIRGKKRADVSAVDCVRAAFPGGSMTGAPKLRSMELLESIESCSRGIYSGCIGYFSYNQTFDLNIVIRTIVLHEGEASIGAGGAIVALSDPEAEYEEMLLKTRASTKTVMEFESEIDPKLSA